MTTMAIRARTQSLGTKPPVHAAIYARTSREFKNFERVSIAQQVDDGKRLAVEHGDKEPQVLIDENLSGKMPPLQFADGSKQTRPALSRLLELVQAGQVNAVIVRKRDRLFRSTILALRFYKFLSDHRCRLICTHENLPAGTDASGLFTLTVLAAAAELELGKTSENIKAAKAYARREGRKMGPTWTPGYRDVEGKPGIVEIDEQKAVMVRQVFEKWNAGESVGDICRWLNTDHLDKCKPHSKTSAGPFWHPVSVWRMLQNRRYIGLTSDGDESKLYRPILAAPEIFWNAQERLQARIGTRQRRQHHLRPLSGLLVCGYCGKPMQTISMSAKSKDLKLYACAKTEIPHTEWPFVMRESRWLEFIKRYFWRSHAKPAETPDAVVLRSKLTELARKLDELSKEFADTESELTAAAYSAAVKAVGARRKTLEKQLANLRPSAGSILASWGIPEGSWESVPATEKGIALRRCVREIQVYRDRAEVYTGDGERFLWPLMREVVRGQRPANCLCPSQRSGAASFMISATKVLPAARKRHGRVKWETDDSFFPDSEAAKHYVSRRAKRRHGR